MIPTYFSLRLQTSTSNTSETFALFVDVNANGCSLDRRLHIPPIVNIKNIRIPFKLRRNGFGRLIVETLEKAEPFLEIGVNTFVAVGINHTPDAYNFWRKVGYGPSQSNPAHWYKKLS